MTDAEPSVADRRLALGLSQRTFAKLSGVNRSTLVRIESGDVTATALSMTAVYATLERLEAAPEPASTDYEYVLISGPISVTVFAAMTLGVSRVYRGGVLMTDLTDESIPVEWRDRAAKSPGNWFLLRVDLNNHVEDDDED